MQHIAQHIELIANSTQPSDKEKVLAISNAIREQYTVYPEEEYEDASLYGTELDPEDFTYEGEEGTFWIETLEDRCDTNLDPIYLEEGLDAGLLAWVRAAHEQEQVRQADIDTYDKLDDVMSINTSGRNRQKFAVMKVSRDGNGIRKVIRNEEGNFEERIEDDKPDWVREAEARDEAISKANRETKARKMLWKQLREDRINYKKFYDAYDKVKGINPTEATKLKKRGDTYYKSYKYYSKLQDELTAIDAKEATQRKQREANNILSLFVDFQQCAPAHLIEKLLREDVVAYYKSYGYNSTINYLQKCIKRAKELAKH